MKCPSFGRLLPWVLLTCLLGATTCSATTNHYVAANGTSSGDGSLDRPWDLQTALNQPTSVQSGDTIWLRAGTYVSTNGGFISHLQGTATSPIIVRNYKGERATIDGEKNALALYVAGSDTWFWGLEIMSSCTARRAPTSTCSLGVGAYGPRDKFINLVVHDTTQGFSGYNAAADNEFYGNLSYYNGFTGPDRNHGHGMYFQNISGTKTIADNFVGDNADEGIQVYGSGNAALIDIAVTGNTLYNNSSWPNPPNYQYNLIIAGGHTRKNIRVEDNYSYFPAASGLTAQFGQYDPGEDMSVKNNVFANGGVGVNFTEQSGPIVFTGNTIVSPTGALRAVTVNLAAGQTLALYTWDNNTYYDQSWGHFYKGVANGGNFEGVNESFSSWQQKKFDAHSTYKATMPNGVWVFVRPNKYEPKRANVTVFNWDSQTTVFADLSKLLRPGDRYQIRDAQDFYGPAVETGIYSGKPVAIRMTNLTKAAPVGFPAPPHTAPTFGTFVVLPAAVQTAH